MYVSFLSLSLSHTLTLSVCMCVSECISIVRSKESNAEEKILAFAKQALFERLKQTRKKERERLQKNTRQIGRAHV